MITAKIIEDSLNTTTKTRLTTFLVSYPRIIHAERLRHRVFSASVSSTRAIPSKKAIARSKADIYVPEFTQNMKGMASNFLLGEKDMESAKKIWNDMVNCVLEGVEKLSELNVHKQHACRPLEFFSNITELITGTDFENFFSLRLSKSAQPEIRRLAEVMAIHYYENSTPKEISPQGKSEDIWHIPFRDKMEGVENFEDKLKISIARCARLSYENFDGDSNPASDIELFQKLLKSGHWSPMEHLASATQDFTKSGNFGAGWKQYRKMFQSENQSFDYEKWKADKILELTFDKIFDTL